MSTQEKQEIMEINEELIERFTREAEEADNEADEYTALGMVHMLSEQNNKLLAIS